MASRDLLTSEALARDDWGARVRQKLVRFDAEETLEVEEILAAAAAVRHAAWPGLVRSLIALTPRYEDYAEEVYGQRVSRHEDDGPALDSWMEDNTFDRAARLLGLAGAIEQPAWEALLSELLGAYRKHGLDARAVIDEVLAQPHVFTHAKFAKAMALYDKKGGNKDELAVLKRWLDKKRSGNTRVASYAEVMGHPIAQLKKRGYRQVKFEGERLFNGVPPDLLDYGKLETLWFDKVALEELPDDIAKLANLRELVVYRCPLERIAPGIGKLARLERLRLGDGVRVEALPDAIGHLQALRELRLDLPRLTRLPDAIGKLVKLQTLGFSAPKVTELPRSIGGLEGLETLYIDKVGLRTLPVEIGELTALETLHLERLALTTLPESMRKLTRLRRLKLRLAHLTELPEWLCHLPDLEYLDVGGSRLKVLPRAIGRAKKLAWMVVKGNPLETGELKRLSAALPDCVVED